MKIEFPSNYSLNLSFDKTCPVTTAVLFPQPSVVEHLRKWTSKEAMGEVTAQTDASMRISSGVTLTPDELSECGSGDDEPIDHRLPSPEEQLRVIANK